MNRRDFLRKTVSGAAAGLVGGGLAAGGPAHAQDGPGLARRKMGKTGLECSEVGLGTLKCSDKAIVRYAFDKGVNYFDTARKYQNGNAEIMLGEVLSELPRDEFVITDKVPWTCTTVADMGAEIDKALSLLKLDYIDFVLYHKMDSPEMVLDEWFEVAEDYKKQGKIRYQGVSTHARVVDVCRLALEKGVDQLLVGYNVVAGGAEKIEDLEAVIADAAAQGVAVVAMKTASGKDLETVKAFREEGMSFFASALKWPLQNPNICSAISEITTMDMLDENIKAAAPMTEREAALLQRFADARGPKSFLHWDLQDGGCPNGVAIADVLRSRAYYVDYGDLYMARANYHRIARHQRPEACSGCPACDAVGEELREAQRYLA
jgi:aryl-alcohol dehydrogenase-like predicted oxidoreductase